MKAMSRLAGTLLCSIARRPQRVLSYCTRWQPLSTNDAPVVHLALSSILTYLGYTAYVQTM